MKSFIAQLLLAASLFTANASADFEVIISGITNPQGFVHALVFQQKDGFPSKREKALTELSIKASETVDGKLTLKFTGIPEIQGVVCIFHDLDNNGIMNQGLFGIPKEPVTITGWNGKGRPKFKRCLRKLTGNFQVRFIQL